MEPVKSMCKCPEFVKDVLVAIAGRRGITRPRFTYENGSNYGDGFIGMVTRVVIVDDDSGMEMRLICKHLKHDPNDTDNFTSMDMFKREIFIYSHVLPEIVRLQLEKNIPADEGFFSFPKCHFARFSEENQEAALIFDDLRFEGYQMLEKRQIPDVEHVKLLMRQLGRLHAVSFALREQKPEILEQFKCLDDVLTKLMRRKVMQPLAVKNCRLAQSILTPEDDMVFSFYLYSFFFLKPKSLSKIFHIILHRKSGIFSNTGNRQCGQIFLKQSTERMPNLMLLSITGIVG